MGEGFDDLDRAEPDVESGVDVHFELWLTTAEGGEHPEGDKLPLRRGQAGTVVDIAEAVGDDMVSKGGGDVGERRDDALAARAVDRVEHGRAALISGLLAFAAGLLERPTVFTRHVQVGVTLPGYTVEGFQELGRAGVLESAQVYLCPVGLADVFGSDSTPKCLNVFIGNGNKLIAGASGITKTVTVDGVAARFNTDPGGAVALVGHEFGAWIHGHQLGGLSDLDAATLAAAVRVDPAVSIG